MKRTGLTPAAGVCLAVAAWAATVTGPLAAKADNLVFSYFVDNGEDGLHLAHSPDGYKWTPLNGGASFLAPAVGGKLMRDPNILLGPDGTFHMVWTTGWWEQGIGIAHSKDLLDWSEQEFLPLMVHERRAVNCWAPEIVWDDELQQYMIFWSTTIPGRFPETDDTGDPGPEGVGLNHRIYRTTTKDFKEYSRTELFYDPGFDVIDATLFRDGRQWVMFVKDETRSPEEKKTIRMTRADFALGPYLPASDPISPDNRVEGPTAVRVGRDLFVYFDAYSRNRFEGVRSRDLKSWTSITDRLEFPAGARHGTVFMVDDKVLKGLRDAR